jgi:ATP-binding cassette subfamily D (ALD) long-chain fatty acid import protein
MASFPSLRLSQRSNERLANAAKVYMAHRPMVQRVLNISFIAFILASSYFGVSSKPSANQSTRKGKSKKGKDGEHKPNRVAVCGASFCGHELHHAHPFRR